MYFGGKFKIFYKLQYLKVFETVICL